MWHLVSGASYRITGNKTSRLRNLYAASILASRYNVDGDYILAWNGQAQSGYSIIDCLMNLPLLYWASRELVKHLKGGSLTNPEHTEYTWNTQENIESLAFLANWDAVEFDPSIVGGDEIALFYNGTLNVAFCWNAAQQTNPNTANTGAGLTANGDEILYMAFPGDTTADIRLGCQNYGFGIFDNGDPARVAAAKEFIKYFCAGEGAPAAVRATNNFPADTTIVGTYEGHEAEAILNDYNKNMLPLAGDYYQGTTGWAEARTNWWNMLQEVGASDGSIEAITEIVNARCDAANGK